MKTYYKQAIWQIKLNQAKHFLALLLSYLSQSNVCRPFDNKNLTSQGISSISNKAHKQIINAKSNVGNETVSETIKDPDILHKRKQIKFTMTPMLNRWLIR